VFTQVREVRNQQCSLYENFTLSKCLFQCACNFTTMYSRPGVGNFSLVAGQKQTQQGVAGRTNFPPTINSVPFVVNDTDKTWEFMGF